MLEFTIPYPEDRRLYKLWMKDYSLNAIYQGKHWSKRREDAEYWHWLTLSRVPQAKMFDVPVKVTMYWNDSLDIDNHSYMGKMIVDAMKGRVIEDDSRRWVKGVCHYFHDEDYISVEIHEV